MLLRNFNSGAMERYTGWHDVTQVVTRTLPVKSPFISLPDGSSTRSDSLADGGKNSPALHTGVMSLICGIFPICHLTVMCRVEKQGLSLSWPGLAKPVSAGTELCDRGKGKGRTC